MGDVVFEPSGIASGGLVVGDGGGGGQDLLSAPKVVESMPLPTDNSTTSKKEENGEVSVSVKQCGGTAGEAGEEGLVKVPLKKVRVRS